MQWPNTGEAGEKAHGAYHFLKRGSGGGGNEWAISADPLAHPWRTFSADIISIQKDDVLSAMQPMSAGDPA